jgi:hypothetical protein
MIIIPPRLIPAGFRKLRFQMIDDSIEKRYAALNAPKGT